MIKEIISAFVLGLIGGLIPGPVLTAIFTEILQSGIWKSFRIILWSMFTEIIVALISLLILSSTNFSDGFFSILSIIGAGILFWIATQIWKINKIDTTKKVHFSLGKISTMIMTNGVLWTFWITVCVPKAIMLDEKIALGKFLFLIFVEIGWFFSTSLVAIIFLQFRKILSNPKIVPIIFKFFALTFIYFAVDMLYNSINFFIN